MGQYVEHVTVDSVVLLLIFGSYSHMRVQFYSCIWIILMN